MVAQLNWTEELVAPLDWIFEIDRLPDGSEVVPALVELTTPAQPLRPKLNATPASVRRKATERLLAEKAALSIYQSPQLVTEIA